MRYDDLKEVNKYIEKKDIPLDKIADHVQEATDYLCGKDANIQNQLITLQVTRPQAPTLTLIDLPGIVRVRTGVGLCSRCWLRVICAHMPSGGLLLHECMDAWFHIFSWKA